MLEILGADFFSFSLSGAASEVGLMGMATMATAIALLGLLWPPISLISGFSQFERPCCFSLGI